MNEQQRFLLISEKKAIGDDLDPKDIFSYLQSKFVLDSDEVELIKAEVTRRKRTEKLLSTLADKDNDAFVHFHGALKYASYQHLAGLLKTGLNGSELSNGADNNLVSGDIHLIFLCYLYSSCLHVNSSFEICSTSLLLY